MQGPIALIPDKIYTGKAYLEGSAVLIQEGVIRGIVPQEAIPSAYQVQDVQGHALAPGLIDLQIYGGGGSLFASDCSAQAAGRISKALCATGTTGYYLTLATNTAAVFQQAIEVMHTYRHPALLGLHFEGPYLHKSKRGAHPEHLIRKAELKELEAWVLAASGSLKMITIAPEEVDSRCIRFLEEAEVLVSAGHSNASFQEAMLGFQAGVRAVTHLFNAMSPLHHRNPGLAGAVFQHPTACASIIADGIHVHYEMVDIAKKLLKERLFLITDAVETSHSGIYQHILNGDHFTLPDGTLSGSALSLLQAVKNCVQHTQIDLEEALRMASLYPSNLIGRQDLGRIEAGCKANLILLDAELQLRKVYLEGQAIDPL